MSVTIIAEIGPNHNGDINIAKDMINGLAKSGVDVIKFQLSDPVSVLSLDSFKAAYQIENDNKEDLIAAAESRQLSHEDHIDIKHLCDALEVEYMCTAFDIGSLTFIDKELQVKRFKVASGEIFSLDMGKYIAMSKKPVIISTGMASEEEISKAIEIYNPGNEKDKVTLLHCVSNYPADYSEVNLRWLPRLKDKAKVDVGYSDHTLGFEASLAAVALGASVIEKHVTLDKTLKGPDHKASLTVEEFSDFVKHIRNVELSLGVGEKIISKAEKAISLSSRKSIVSKVYIPTGTKIEENHLCFKRPGTGFLPFDLDKIVGKRASRDIKADRVIKKEDIIG